MLKELTYRKFVKQARNTPSAHLPLRESIKPADDEEEHALNGRRRPSRLKRSLYTLVPPTSDRQQFSEITCTGAKAPTGAAERDPTKTMSPQFTRAERATANTRTKLSWL